MVTLAMLGINLAALSQDNSVLINKVVGEEIGKTAGKLVYVDFWATWCRPCLQSMPHTIQLYEEFGDQIVFIALTQEEESKVRNFLQKRSWKLPFALDYKSQTHKNFKIRAIPQAYLIQPDGKILWEGHPNRMNESKMKEFLEQHTPSIQSIVRFME